MIFTLNTPERVGGKDNCFVSQFGRESVAAGKAIVRPLPLEKE